MCEPVSIVYVERHVSISMMIMCNGIVSVYHDRRTLGLPSAPVVMEHDNKRIEEILLNIPAVDKWSLLGAASPWSPLFHPKREHVSKCITRIPYKLVHLRWDSCRSEHHYTLKISLFSEILLYEVERNH